MRAIPASSTTSFLCLNSLVLVLAIGATVAFSEFTGIGFSKFPPWLFGLSLFYAGNLVCYKWLLIRTPRRTGIMAPGSRFEHEHNLLVLYFLFYLYPISFSKLLIPPFTSIWHRFLGARIGKASFPSACLIGDSQYVTVGDECVLGANSILSPHISVGNYYALEKIELGNRVTIGVQSVVYGGVRIGDGALVLPHSCVTPGARIGPNEMWGGNPAKKVKVLKPGDRAWNGVPQTASPVWAGEKGLEIARGV